jgi:hypothetical protein
MLVVRGLKVNKGGSTQKAALSKGKREQNGMRETTFWMSILYPPPTASPGKCVASQIIDKLQINFQSPDCFLEYASEQHEYFLKAVSPAGGYQMSRAPSGVGAVSIPMAAVSGQDWKVVMMIARAMLLNPRSA